MRRIVLLILLFLHTLSFAKGEPEANTFLYQISKPGRPVSYLLGTIHVGKNPSSLPSAYLKALNQVSQLVVESDEQSFSPQQMQQLATLTYDKRPLQHSLGAARFQRLQNMIQNGAPTLSIPPTANLKPWAVLLSVQTQFSPPGYSYRYGIDYLLLDQARIRQKIITPLESLEPLSDFNSLPEAAVLRAIDRMIQHSDAFLADENKLIHDYQHQQAKTLWADITNPDKQLQFYPAHDRPLWQQLFYQKLLTQRNQRWLPKLIELLPKQPTLIAVGSAHLFGEQGLIVRLRQVGYQIEPVKIEAIQ